MVKSASQIWRPSGDDYMKVFVEQNPWHESGEVPEALAFTVERPLAKYLWQRITTDQPKRFQLILGPRRVGKSTAMFQTVRHLLKDSGIDKENICWLRLDHPLLMRVDLNVLVKFFIENRGNAKAKLYLFLDELTYAKDWDLWLKTFYDDAWPVQIVGSSSSTAALRDRKMESGVGRWEEQFLSPYLFTEFLELNNVINRIPVRDTFLETLYECMQMHDLPQLAEKRRRYLLTGGFPELLLDNTKSIEQNEESILLRSQRILRTDAVQSAIYKDIPQAFGVNDPLLLERLLYTLAGQVTGILSPNKMCVGLSMSQPTFDRYLSFLEKAFLVFTLPNYSGSEVAIQKKRGRKLYFVDGAVRNAALQRGLAPLSNEPEMGTLLENMAAGHLYSLCQHTNVRLFHWRDKDDEVDLIYDHPDKPMAFEIALNPNHHRRGLWTFANRYQRFAGSCFLISPTCSPIMPDQTLEQIGRIPLDVFLIAASAQAERELYKNLQAGP